VNWKHFRPVWCEPVARIVLACTSTVFAPLLSVQLVVPLCYSSYKVVDSTHIPNTFVIMFTASVNIQASYQIIITIIGAAGCVWTRAVLRLLWAFRERHRRRFLWLSSTLNGSVPSLAVPPHSDGSSWFWLQIPDRWRGFCPSCKRPVTAGLTEDWSSWMPQPAESAKGKFAYVIFLWGASKDCVHLHRVNIGFYIYVM